MSKKSSIAIFLAATGALTIATTETNKINAGDNDLGGLKECIFDGKYPDPGPVPEDKLTYKVGDKVKCKTGGWGEGIVTQLWYREDLWETGRYAPYQVLLESGDVILVPRDSNFFVKNYKNRIDDYNQN